MSFTLRGDFTSESVDVFDLVVEDVSALEASILGRSASA
ncbi:hypothetical protein PSCLAVI8L_130716 [Pseudoclavibacter sp. 8L]|nr:hypothetical protein PSCLAVI8L_130716 [Pseudoclavibacter sp. 8L]